MKKKYTGAAWNGDKSQYSVEQLTNAVPKAVAQYAKKQAGSGQVTKDALELPYKLPDGTISEKGIQAALECIGGAHGNKPNLPDSVLSAAKKELLRELGAAKKALGKSGTTTTSQADDESSQSWLDLIDQVKTALYQQFQTVDSQSRYWLEDMTADYVIVGCYEDGELYKMSYMIEGNKVTFGTPVMVEEQYVEVSTPAPELGDMVVAAQSQHRFGVVLRQSIDPEGWRWRVQVCRFGMSKTRDIWERQQFQQSLPLWEGIGCYADHPTLSEMRDLPERSIKNLAGWWSDFEVAQGAMDATLTIKPSADWMRQDIMAAHKAGKNDLYEFSILVQTKARQVNGPDGQPARTHEIIKPISIDAVTDAAADGHIKYALASTRANSSEGEKQMNKSFLVLLFKRDKVYFEAVRQSLVALNAKGVAIVQTEDQLADAIVASEVVGQQATVVMQTIDAVRTPGAPAGTTTQQSAQPGTPGRMTMDQLPGELVDGLIRQAYSDSGLPEGVQQKIKTRLGAAATITQVQSAIADAKELMGVVEQSEVHNPGRIVADSADKMSIGLAKAFGLSFEDFNGVDGYYDDYVRQSGSKPYEAEKDMWNSVSPVISLREFYIGVTGDRNMRGGIYSGTRNLVHQTGVVRQATWLTSDFSTLLGNVVNKRLLRDYRGLAYPLERIMYTKPAKDFKPQEAILLGYFGNLPSVAQNGAYTVAGVLTNTEETYSIAKLGELVQLTLEDIANDDLGGFVRIVSRLGRAAKRTLANFVLNTCVMANPTMNADGLAVFHVNHANLINDALGTNGLRNAINALLSQTEPGSGQKLAVTTDDLTLWCPPGLYLDAQTITDFNNSPGGEQQGMAQTVRRLGITPVSTNVFTDSNDWLLTASPADLDMVEVGFYNGNEEPEFFVQADPTQGDSFAQDVVMKHKIRHIYGGTPVDYRGMVQSSVLGS
jgi:hypothetical protein